MLNARNLFLCAVFFCWLGGISAEGLAEPEVLAPPSPEPLVVDALHPASTGGLAFIDRILFRLGQHRRLLMIAAHPDDEDTRLLTLVARGQGGEAAYLSLSRGDGGQNLIGKEVGPGLGLLRSRELQAARGIDGAHQFFTRAYDFGFTTSLEETFRRWPREVLLEDALRVARRFKPQVLVAVFPASAQAGHGQHWASAVIADEVFAQAGAPHATLDAEGSLPWPITSFFRSAFFNPQAATTRLSLGLLDAHDGRSILQLALASRSQHRCQDMGQEQPIGNAESLLTWVAGNTEQAPPSDLFAGIDTRLRAIVGGLSDQRLREELAKELDGLEAKAAAARHLVSATRRADVVAPLGELVLGFRAIYHRLDPRIADQSLARELIGEKWALAQEGYAAAAAIALDALADRESVVAGEVVKVRTQLWSAEGRRLANLKVEPVTSQGFRLMATSPPPAPAGFFSTKVDDDQVLELQVPPGTPPSVPYFRRSNLQGDLYDWSEVPSAVRGLPFEPDPLRMRWSFELEGIPVSLTREVVYRYRDQAVGEIRRPLRVLPKVEVALDRHLWLWPSTRDAKHAKLHVSLRSRVLPGDANTPPIVGRLQVKGPEGWSLPSDLPFSIPAATGSIGVDIPLTPPPALASGRYRIEVAAQVGEEIFDHQQTSIDYPHIRPTNEPRQAVLEIAVLEVAIPQKRRIGYVRGASDTLPELLAEIGLEVDVLAPATLEEGDLSGYDVVVIGPRAYEVEPALLRSNRRLLDFVEGGGRLVVQYQQYQYVRGQFPPFPFQISSPHDRVTDENSPVRLLEEGHRFFREPNLLGPADWQGWVQERGLYFAGKWDAAYTPLLAMNDPGGAEKQGALLVAKVGQGQYVYSGLAFFRQLPAGVSGAWRLFVNLLS